MQMPANLLTGRKRSDLLLNSGAFQHETFNHARAVVDHVDRRASQDIVRRVQAEDRGRKIEEKQAAGRGDLRPPASTWRRAPLNITGRTGQKAPRSHEEQDDAHRDRDESGSHQPIPSLRPPADVKQRTGRQGQSAANGRDSQIALGECCRCL